MIPRLHRSHSRGGFTLVELVVSLGVGVVVMGAVVMGGVAFQTVFNAEDDYYQSTADQLRVLDYIACDVRNAISGTVSNNGQTLVVQLPDYINPATNTPRIPTVTPSKPKSAGNVKYFANAGDSVTATYAVNGNTVTRTQVAIRSGVTTTTSATIANNVDNLQLTDSSGSGSTNFSFGPLSMSGSNGWVQFVQITLTFMPRFNRLNRASARAGTSVSETIAVRGN